MYKAVTAEEAVKVIKNNDRVYIHATAAAPQELIKAMSARHEELRNVRHTLEAGNGSYTPIFLSELPILFKRNIIDLDVALIQVSPPDKHGYCTLGVSVEATLAAIDNANHVIAQINPNMPRVLGDGIIHITELDTLVEHQEVIHELAIAETTDVEAEIASYIAGIIDNGSTLQMGIGNIPNAVLSRLVDHKNLGLHTEMFSDGVIDLILKDVINGNEKGINAGRGLATFLMGTKRLYDYVDDNPFVELRASDYVNDVSVIKQNPKMVAINSAIEIDLTGQVCADSIGSKMYSGVGGQMDFIRGASLSEGGKAIIAIPSQTSKGISRIVPFLKKGAGIVTTRAHIHYVVTEYGIADLYGKTIKQRIKALVNIAHPDHQETIERSYFDARI